jgi:type IV pilus assembly protein PilX
MMRNENMKSRFPEPRRHREHGGALIVALVLLLVMTVLGVTAMRNTTLQERMAGNLRDNNLAFQAAERALREGETFLQQPTVPPFTGANGLLQAEDGAGSADFWNTFDWAGNGRVAAGITGVARDPLYVIEELPPVAAEGGSERFGPLPDVAFYRVTAQAVGGTQDAVSILQSTYRR